MKLQIDNITLPPDRDEKDILPWLARTYALHDVTDYLVMKKSLDARDKGSIVYRYRIVIDIDEEKARGLLEHRAISPFVETPKHSPVSKKSNVPILIAGSGPAGLFCALRLIEAGLRVTLFERGKPVEERMKDIAVLENTGRLSGESNVLFGEGGAGTYSDGKLTARTRRPESQWFFHMMVRHGAAESILYEAKPHVGTDRLRNIITNIRRTILESGSEIHFNEHITGIIQARGSVRGLRSASGKEFTGDRVVLATGHSARDMYDLLSRENITLEKKGFAVGLRVEHPAAIIREIQYGGSPYRDILPAAEYMLTHNNTRTGRGIYSFCMCPGGKVVNSSSEDGRLCVNGMSNSRRDSRFSNAALVVTVRPEDTGEDIMSGIEFQRRLEEAAFNAGGGNFTAPAQRLTSFLQGKTDTDLPDTSYRPGVRACDVAAHLPSWIIEELKLALPVFNRKMKGFVTGEALLIGAETRTSSPLRILRGDDFQSVTVRGLYPAGEGAGYAGGIVSSAVDGIRVADVILQLM